MSSPLPPGTRRVSLHESAVPMPDFEAEGTDPVDWVEMLRATYGALAPVRFEADVAAWLVLDYEAVRTVLQNERAFPRASSHWRELVEGRFTPGMAIHPMFSDRGGLNALCLDGTKHHRRRTAIDWALESLPNKRVESDVAELAESVIDRFCTEGTADLVADFAAVLPALVLNRWFGMTQEEFGTVVTSMTEQWNAGADSTAAQQRLVRHGMAVAARKRAELAKGTVGPKDDLVAALISAPQGLTDTEIAFDLELLIGASFEPVKNLIASTLYLMLTDRDLRYEVSGSYPIQRAVDAALWKHPPIAAMPGRFPRADVEVAGQLVRAGEGLVPCYLAANRDPKQMPHDGLINQAYLSFGLGAHGCPARSTGRGIVTVAVERLHRRLDLRLSVSPDTISMGRALYMRGPTSLPVSFLPAPQSHGGLSWNPPSSPSASTPAGAITRIRPGGSVLSGPSSLLNSLRRWLSGR